MSAIPPVFEASATIVVPDEAEGRVEDAAVVLGLLTERSLGRPWWLGYLDTDADRSWLMSWLWDDTWRCLGGPAALIGRFADEPRLQVRRVGPGEGATPPGHVAY
jgi:hypothetical protein